RERCERGCYDCLLSYTNQTDHYLIDRHAVVDLLRELAGSTTNPTGGHPGGEAARAADLAGEAGSDLEREVLAFLRDGGYRLPDEAQPLVGAATVRPDFVYRLPAGPVAVFVDGPHHDDTTIRGRDAAAADRLLDLGWLVVRFRYDD